MDIVIDLPTSQHNDIYKLYDSIVSSLPIRPENVAKTVKKLQFDDLVDLIQERGKMSDDELEMPELKAYPDFNKKYG